jgi:hypothetical protein
MEMFAECRDNFTVLYYFTMIRLYTLHMFRSLYFSFINRIEKLGFPFKKLLEKDIKKRI